MSLIRPEKCSYFAGFEQFSTIAMSYVIKFVPFYNQEIIDIKLSAGR